MSAQILASKDDMIQSGVIEEITDRLLDHDGEVHYDEAHVIFDNAQVSVTVECGLIEIEGHITNEEGLTTTDSHFVGSDPNEAIDTAVTFLLAVRENTGNDAD